MVDQYEQMQLHYWEQLRQELQRYKAELGTSHSELAEGMGISRQPVVSFMQKSRQDLPIYRSNLIRLWNRRILGHSPTYVLYNKQDYECIFPDDLVHNCPYYSMKHRKRIGKLQ